jgi:HEAT repeat protein
VRAPLRLVAVPAFVSVVLALACVKPTENRVAELVEDLRSPDAAAVDRAVRQLVEMGEPAVPALILALKDPEARVRSAAASALWGLGPKARNAVPTLAEALADNDEGVRLGVVMALESVGRDAAAAVPALSRAVRDRDGNVRLWAAKALGKIGPPARAALPALTEAARYDSTRAAAEDAIRAFKGP